MVTMLGAVALDGIRTMVAIEAATCSELFTKFVVEHLVPTLKAGEVVVMDNLAAHKTPRAVQAIQGCGAEVLYLPPYSPEFNPIEKAWAKLKDFMRKLKTQSYEEFCEALRRAMDAVKPADIWGWTMHAGYSLSST